MTATTDFPMSRADRRALEKLNRRAPKKVRRPKNRAGLPLALSPWKVDSVWRPLDEVIERVKIDGTVEAANGKPVAYDHSTSTWYEIAPAIEGLAEFHELAATKKGQMIDVAPLRRIATKLAYSSPLTGADIEAVQACATRCKALARMLTGDEAASLLRTVQVGIALENRG